MKINKQNNLLFLVFVQFLSIALLFGQDSTSDGNGESKSVFISDIKKLFPINYENSIELQNKLSVIHDFERQFPDQISMKQFFQELNDTSGQLQYTRFLIETAESNISQLSDLEKQEVLSVLESIYFDINRNDSLRISAIKASDDFLWNLYNNSIISEQDYHKVSKRYLKILFNDNDFTQVRLATLKAIRGVKDTTLADELIYLLSRHASLPLKIQKALLTTLGEWKHSAVIPVIREILETTSDQEIIDATAYALRHFQRKEIIPLLLLMGS